GDDGAGTGALPDSDKGVRHLGFWAHLGCDSASPGGYRLGRSVRRRDEFLRTGARVVRRHGEPSCQGYPTQRKNRKVQETLGMATLTDRQFEIDGFVFGWRAPSRIGISDVDFGSPEARTNDFDRPRLDGQRFGREYRSGRLITLELVTLHTGEQALDDLERFLEAWNAAAVRDSPGDMSVLRYNVRGRTRRVYGRPREVELETADYHLGKIVITAQFMTEGPYFYGDEPEQTTVGIAPGITGGFVFPLSFPASTIGMGERREGVVNPSRLPAPAVFDIHGPIENPIIEIPGV